MRAAAVLLFASLLGGCSRAPSVERFRVALGSRPLSLDPHHTNEQASFVIHASLFETLVRRDAGQNLEPGLARSWFTPDDCTWVFELQPGVRFHDGSPLTPDDVAYSLIRVRDDPRSDWRPYARGIASVETPAPDRLVIRTARPQPMLMHALAAIEIVPRRFGEGGALAEHPVGTGPYRFVSASSDRSVVELERFEGYRGPRAALQRVQFVALPDETARRKALRERSVDMLLDVPREGIEDVRDDAEWQLLRAPGLRLMFLAFDVARATTPYVAPGRNPFRDARVRRAFRLAIDSGRIVGEILPGLATPASQLVAPGVFGYEPDLQPVQPDPAEARRLLAQAGFPQGFAVTLHAPRLVYLGDLEIAGAVARALLAIGVKTEVAPQTKEQLFRRVAERDTSFYLLAWSCLSADSQEVFDALLRAPDAARGLGEDNGGGYSNPEVERLVERASETVDATPRLALLRAASRAAMADQPWIPIYVQTQVYALRRAYAWTPRRDKRLNAADVTRRVQP